MASAPATVEQISTRLAVVRQRIDAARTAGQEVSIVAVTKTFGPDLVEHAVAAGLTVLGENYAQELVAKADALRQRSPDVADRVRWHFIGGLQSNKIKMLDGLVDLWQTIDRRSLVKELAKRRPGAALLIQVNTTDEPQKSGCVPADVGGLVDDARNRGLDVRGLMTMGPADGSDPRPAFELLRRLGADHDLTELSMGMSGDYEIAVAYGATMVRIGSALFGPRERP